MSDASSEDRWWASPWMHAAALALVVLAVFSRYGVTEYPVTNDRAYFTYLGQAVLRGEPYYRTTFMVYPPLATLLAAGSMWLGRWFDVPTYIAPRYLSVLAGMASVMLVYAVTRRATGSAWSGILAGIVLAAFGHFGWLTVASLEPKSLVIVFTLATCVSLQSRRWLWAGVAAGAAATCWQPAGLIPLACFPVVLWGGRSRLWRAVSRYVLGGFLATIPSVLYLSLTESWGDFWMRSVVIPASVQLPTAGTNVFFWLQVVERNFRTEIIFFQAAALGFAWFIVRAPWGGIRRVGADWLDPRQAGVPLLTLVWSSFNCVEFGSLVDMLPMLPLVAFWVGWLAHCVVKTVVSIPSLRPRPKRAISYLMIGALLMSAPIYGFADTVRYAPLMTLNRQKALVERIIEPAGPDGLVMAVRAEAIYVLSERQSPIRFLRIEIQHQRFLHLVYPKGCDGVVEEIIASRPAVMVMRQYRYSSYCMRLIERALVGANYRRAEINWRERAPIGWMIRWSVFTDATL